MSYVVYTGERKDSVRFSEVEYTVAVSVVNPTGMGTAYARFI